MKQSNLIQKLEQSAQDFVLLDWSLYRFKVFSTVDWLWPMSFNIATTIYVRYFHLSALTVQMFSGGIMTSRYSTCASQVCWEWSLSICNSADWTKCGTSAADSEWPSVSEKNNLPTVVWLSLTVNDSQTISNVQHSTKRNLWPIVLHTNLTNHTNSFLWLSLMSQAESHGCP